MKSDLPKLETQFRIHGPTHTNTKKSGEQSLAFGTKRNSYFSKLSTQYQPRKKECLAGEEGGETWSSSAVEVIFNRKSFVIRKLPTETWSSSAVEVIFNRKPFVIRKLSRVPENRKFSGLKRLLGDA
ncbi:hypothetical protein CEXT_539281 [Caerostris extrusa]|uniref:Ribosomal protein L32 n=1 Tax=Caerostris extrusa TaxID=172846 RepID=A0AAV4TME8_CAEEX|nr:hypothetical protein CEXT_539281 [Caerostris extrusa]